MNYYVKKLISAVITLLFIMMLSFLIFQIIPGDAAITKLGMGSADESALEALRETYGYNGNVFERFFRWISGAVRGDFGMSLQYSQTKVSELIGQRLPVTLWLSGISVLMIILISIPVGIITSKKKNGLADRMTGWFSQLVMAIPSFVQGIIVTLIFGLVLEMFIPGDYTAPEKDFWKFIRFMIFPSLAVALPKIAMTVKFMKSSINREYEKDYIRTARAKGNDGNAVLWKHILKNTMLPVITFIGLIITEVMAGSILIEQVFNLPGMGRLLVTAVSNRDFQVVQAVVMYIAFVVITVNFIVDILYRVADPRQD